VTRAATFACVGALGFAVQLAVVASLIGLARWPAPAATALGVEAAVLHNFAWHRRWTWRERGESPVASQLLRFHLANGVASLAGNVGLSIALTAAGLNPLLANAIAVGVMSAVNYLVADRWVFLDGDNGGGGGNGLTRRCEGTESNGGCRTFVRLRSSVPPVNPFPPSSPAPPTTGGRSAAR